MAEMLLRLAIASCLLQFLVAASFGPIIESDFTRVLGSTENLSEFLDSQFPGLELQLKKQLDDSSNNSTHLYFAQVFGNVTVDNGHVNANLRRGRFISFGSTGIARRVQPGNWPEESLTKAFGSLKLGAKPLFSKYSEGKFKAEEDSFSVVATQAYLTVDKVAHPVWKISLRGNLLSKVAYVQTTPPFSVLSQIDYTRRLAYKPVLYAVPVGYSDPTHIKQIAIEPDSLASPDGWFLKDSGNITTVGNNVWVQENWDANDDYKNKYRPTGSKNGFKNSFDAKKSPKENVDASIINVFFWVNTIHDILYNYGFTESSGNFQTDNFGRGGKSNDALIVNVQDGSGLDDAYFQVSPDGESSVLSLSVFKQTDPARDGALQSDIIVHEYMHGVSTRLTGGAEAPGCLPYGEPLGLGEGWGDFAAILLCYQPQEKKRGIAVWANGKKTLRTFWYSPDLKQNPLTFEYLAQKEWQPPHKIGEIWAVMLYQMYWELRNEMGEKHADWKSASPNAPNTLALRLVIDAMKRQPCSPGFITARDAILEADGGKNACAIWKAFSMRGLGPKAKSKWTKTSVEIQADFSSPCN